MIQDISPHHFDNHFISGLLPAAGDILFSFSGEDILCRTEGNQVLFPYAEDFSKANGFLYLFRVDDQRFFLKTGDILPPSEPFSYTPLRRLRKRDVECRHLIFAAVTARHLNDWYLSARFCGRCGNPLKHSNTERAMICPACGKTFYPRINPAVIVGITNGDALLMTKYAGRNMPFYALVAGFSEIGESFEDTVKREVMEEVGLRVTNIRYYKSQPWGFAADLLAGYFCDVDGDTRIHMDANELKEAVWMKREEIPGQPDDFSLTNEMMIAFRDGYST